MLCNYAIRNFEKYGTRVDPATNQVCTRIFVAAMIDFDWLIRFFSNEDEVQQISCTIVGVPLFYFFPFSPSHHSPENSHICKSRWCSVVC